MFYKHLLLKSKSAQYWEFEVNGTEIFKQLLSFESAAYASFFAGMHDYLINFKMQKKNSFCKKINFSDFFKNFFLPQTILHLPTLESSHFSWIIQQ